MRHIWRQIFNYLDRLDWFLIRNHPTAWFFRVEYLLFGLITANILAMLFPADIIPTFLLLLFSAGVGNYWLILTFGESEHRYSGNGIAPLFLATLVALEPFILLTGIARAAILQTGFWIVFLLYLSRTVLFSVEPRALSSRPLFAALVITAGTFFLLMSWGVAIRLNGPPSGAPVALVTYVSAELEGMLFSLSGWKMQPTFVEVQPYVSSLLPSPIGTYGEVDLRWIGLAILVVIVGLGLIILACTVIRAFLMATLFNVTLHKALFFPPEHRSEAPWEHGDLEVYSFAMPFWLLAIDLCIRFVFIRHPIGALVSVPGMTAIMAFVMLQSRSFQSYFNDRRALLSPRPDSII